MSGLKEIRLYGTTNTSGAVTIDAPTAVFGYLEGVYVILGTLASGAVDITVSTQNHEAAATMLTITNASASAMYRPRELVHDATGTALTGTAGGDRTRPLLMGVPRCAIASGGDTKSGGVILYYSEE